MSHRSFSRSKKPRHTLLFTCIMPMSPLFDARKVTFPFSFTNCRQQLSCHAVVRTRSAYRRLKRGATSLALAVRDATTARSRSTALL
jgi:hypothetical protein